MRGNVGFGENVKRGFPVDAAALHSDKGAIMINQPLTKFITRFSAPIVLLLFSDPLLYDTITTL